MLKRTTEVVKHREGGDPSSSRKSPGRTEYDAITLERGVTHDPEFETVGQQGMELRRGPGSGRHRSRISARISSSRSTTRPARKLSPTKSIAAGSRNSSRCPISTPTPTPSLSSTSSWRTRAGSATNPSPSRPSRPSATRRDSFSLTAHGDWLCTLTKEYGHDGPTGALVKDYCPVCERYMINTLSEQDILSIWEFSLRQHPVERALTVLAVADPSLSRAHLLASSVGQRDMALLAIREQVFGASFASYAECPQCRAALELAFSANDIRVGAAPETNDGHVLTFECDGYIVQARLPDSADQLAIVSCGNVASARALLLQRCILSVANQGRCNRCG